MQWIVDSETGGGAGGGQQSILCAAHRGSLLSAARFHWLGLQVPLDGMTVRKADCLARRAFRKSNDNGTKDLKWQKGRQGRETKS